MSRVRNRCSISHNPAGSDGIKALLAAVDRCPTLTAIECVGAPTR